MKAVDAEGHDGHLLRQRAHPLFYALWVAPYRTLGDILPSRRVVARTCVNQLDVLTALDHFLHVLWCDRWQVTKFWLPQQRRRRHYGRVLIATLDGSPVDIAHERGYVCLRIGTELDVISVFVHIESED